MAAASYPTSAAPSTSRRPAHAPQNSRDDGRVGILGTDRALEGALGQAGAVDLRFATARVVVRTANGMRLVFLCDPSTNLALLGLSASGVLRRVAPSAAAPPPGAEAPAGKLFQALQRINALIERAGGNPYKLRGRIAVLSGLSLELVDASTPDDPAQLELLLDAAREVLGEAV